MREINSRDLDNWITGHYGEDQFRNELPEVEDEGRDLLNSAINYLSQQPETDDRNEAQDLMIERLQEIEHEYCCQYCGDWIGKKNSYCGRSCVHAASVGM